MEYRLDSPLTQVAGVGPATAKKFKKLGLETVEDLLLYFPFRHEDYSKQIKISEIVEGEPASIIGEVQNIAAKKTPRRGMRLTEALISDESETVRVVWFNQIFVAQKLSAGDTVKISGTPTMTRFGLQISNPIYEKNPQLSDSGSILPVYSLTANLTLPVIRRAVQAVLEACDQLAEWLPAQVIEKEGLMSYAEAVRNIHQPKNSKQLEAARERLAFDELFLVMLRAAQIRQLLEESPAKAQKFFENEIRLFVEKLPFGLTADQKKVAWQIMNDLQNIHPMNRMLQGDVGSGKTVVAALAAFQTALNGQQTAFMVPTTVLARQHYDSLRKLFEGSDVRVGLFTSALRLIDDEEVSVNEMKKRLADGEVDIVVGTQALISKKVRYADLGLIVVDEQHRFGVRQRRELKDRNMTGMMPHFLSLTATPIPRTLSLVMFGDLTVSVLKEKPQGRKPVVTKVITQGKRRQMYEFISERLKNGEQVFVICPLIDPSDISGARSVKEEYERLDKDIFKKESVGLMHGKLSAEEKDDTMRKFADGKIDVLVTTSVIEVGVDVPNATVMLVEGAERFGLAQLHQFRGRVGRSDRESYCFLLPSAEADDFSCRRLELLVRSNDGFALAEHDLKLRGSGDLFGVRQSGMPEFKIASLTDTRQIEHAVEAAADFLKNDNPKNHLLLKERLDELEMLSHRE